MRRVIKSIAAVTLVLVIASLAGFESVFSPQNDDNIDNGHEYVDLGLTSGTLWATCNVGAETPEGYGSYFAWGETRSKAVFDWDTYKYSNGSMDSLTKYCNKPGSGYHGFTDKLIVLETEDDAAKAKWGGEWRTPTAEEWMELYQKTSSVWTSRNGVNGRLFTGRNGNTLFLPAAGYRLDDQFIYVGKYGNYWSNALNVAYPSRAWGFNFNAGDYGKGYSRRCSGQPVRAVRSRQE